MVISASNQACSHRRCLLVIGLVVWLIGSTTECALATGSTQSRYDGDKPVSPLFDQGRRQISVSPLTNDVEADTPQMMPFPTSTELTIVQDSEPAAKEGASSTGPVVVGRVMYRGSVPAPMQMEVTRDSDICGQVVTVTPLAIDPTTHGIRDAIVHVGPRMETVDDGPAQGSTVQNKHCVFYPHVAALQSGAAAEITNDDPVMHNTNITLDSRTVLNVALVAGGNPIRKPLKREGLHLVTCNVHRFMRAYRYVFNHPFFDQTNETGQFRIMRLSPGQHTVSVWHETLGVLHKEIQVPARGTVTVDFEFK